MSFLGVASRIAVVSWLSRNICETSKMYKWAYVKYENPETFPKAENNLNFLNKINVWTLGWIRVVYLERILFSSGPRCSIFYGSFKV